MLASYADTRRSSEWPPFVVVGRPYEVDRVSRAVDAGGVDDDAADPPGEVAGESGEFGRIVREPRAWDSFSIAVASVISRKAISAKSRERVAASRSLRQSINRSFARFTSRKERHHWANREPARRRRPSQAPRAAPAGAIRVDQWSASHAVIGHGTPPSALTAVSPSPAAALRPNALPVQSLPSRTPSTPPARAGLRRSRQRRGRSRGPPSQAP